MGVKKSVSELRRKYVMGMFVDFQNAFDNLEWDVVLDNVSKVKCGELDVWMSYFRDRKVCVTSVDETVWKDVCKRCPQGSICGPTV